MAMHFRVSGFFSDSVDKAAEFVLGGLTEERRGQERDGYDSLALDIPDRGPSLASFNTRSSIPEGANPSRQLHARNLLILTIHHRPLIVQHRPSAHLANRHLFNPDIRRPFDVRMPRDEVPGIELLDTRLPPVFPALRTAGVNGVHERGVQGQGVGAGDEKAGVCEGGAEGDGERVEVRG